ncbi:glutamate/gamma-aminobutyrate family transporter YjeM [Weissella diestrammenae]|uniref:Glutamate/gamma-aminobutyrate family transporter YjeM n=2 Tax=Weissella diestrammenae TaxID=1162633 RepID=A0A7G9T7K9_9LACO|nr:glutamate/gamma-aminobutyrate family transporter YjeM [Weissella diestrammenae]MCM0582653.1 glutamate/gamma-aminobutyrate family transporter YjeM [Weissella diestrammenae]QNN76084.1 glutamate/gamma-aminobutyrate family transporter YjeM [Weissella diestrammenae]
MMIFSTIFGFSNTPIAFLQMGYASIIWYVVAAVLFFLPIGIMMAEYGAAFNQAQGGIYSWIEGAAGPKIAFIGTFMWMASWLTWLVATSSKIWIPLSTFINGSDQTQRWSLFGLNATQTIGILAVFWIIAVTFFASQGINWIAKVSSFGGIMMVILNGAFFLLSFFILFKTGFKTAEPIQGLTTFIHSPNLAFDSPVSMIGFIVFAIFAYAGMETMGGITDSMAQPKRDFPRGILIATAVIAILYALSIFLWGVSANWSQLLDDHDVNLGNVTYIMMHNLGVTFGQQLGLSTTMQTTIGSWFARFVGLDMFIVYVGSFFVLIYSPLKSFVLGTPKNLWPDHIVRLNKQGMPSNAMWYQAGVVIVLILAISFGGASARGFYNILTLMGNVSTALPYLFLVGAYPFFNLNEKIVKPYSFFKHRLSMWLVSGVSFFVLALSVLFTCLDPLLKHHWHDAFWTISGPVVFTLLAILLYRRRQRKMV